VTSLALKNVTICKDGSALFRPLDITVRPGRRVTVTGPSGSGKSSLLAWIAGVLPAPLTGVGEIALDGKAMNDVPAHLRRIGIMFQDDLLFPHLTVGENLAFGLRPGEPKSQVQEALRLAGLPGLEDRDPATLSGGERARIALMRCLLSRPRALLLDEPFSRLDPVRWERMRAFVFEHARDLPILLVSHDPRDAQTADEVVELSPDLGSKQLHARVGDDF
jgi:putative thiamine transport system ATP-binding protein